MVTHHDLENDITGCSGHFPENLEPLKSFGIIAHGDAIGQQSRKSKETKSTEKKQRQRRGGWKLHVCEHSASKLCVCVFLCVCVRVCVGFELSTQAGLAGSQQGYIAPCQAEEAPSGGADRLSETTEIL